MKVYAMGDDYHFIAANHRPLCGRFEEINFEIFTEGQWERMSEELTPHTLQLLCSECLEKFPNAHADGTERSINDLRTVSNTWMVNTMHFDTNSQVFVSDMSYPLLLVYYIEHEYAKLLT